MMSRPLGSAPRKNLPSALSHCGPIGTPSRPTTLTVFPSTLIVSERWFSVAVVWATLFAHSGAARHDSTSRTNNRPNARAILLRRRRRRPSRHGPIPCSCSLAASCSHAAGPGSPACSVKGSVAIPANGPSWRHPTRPGGRRSALPDGQSQRLLEAEARVVVEVDRVEPRAVVEVHPLCQERRQLAVAVRGHPGPLHQLLVEVPPLGGDLIRHLRLLVQLGDPLGDLGV